MAESSVAKLLLAAAEQEYNPYAIEARYGLVAPSGLDRVRAIGDARGVLAWTRGCVLQANGRQ
jgi:hypothetical protein